MGRSRQFGKTPERRVFIAHSTFAALAFAIAFLSLFAAPLDVKKEGRPAAGRELSAVFFPPASRLASSPVPNSNVRLSRRPVFPYSVIPGGVESSDELKNAIARDSVVAKHYAGFDLAKARVIPSDRDRIVYVSYRLGNKVFWTGRAVRLLKGESLITDGRIEARTRCGNRISETPSAPVTPEEPRSKAFEAVQDPEPSIVSSPPFDLPLTPPPETDIQPTEQGGESFIPPIIPILWGPAGTPTVPNVPVVPRLPHPHPHPPPRLHPHPPPPPPASTPEPGTLLLLSTGLSAGWLLRRMWKS